MTIAQWNVRTLLDRETTNGPERSTSLVAMELAKYNIDIAVLSETRFHASGNLNDLEYTFYLEWQAKRREERSWIRMCIQKGHRGKADRNATSNE